MGRPKGGLNRYWSKESKYEIVKDYENNLLTREEVIQKYKISNSQIGYWLKMYREKEINGLENKRKPGNPIAALHTSKSLNEIERLKLEIMKRNIEIERLKKGYMEKDVIKARKS